MDIIARGIATLALSSVPIATQAYIGPGAGLSVLGSVFAFLGAVFLLIAGFVWYPVKRLRNRRREAATRADPEIVQPDRPSRAPEPQASSDEP